MGSKIDLTGQRFGRLTVIEPAPNHGKKTAWRCRCDCGNVVEETTSHLRSGDTISCGCYNDEKRYTHKKTETRLYTIWGNMKQRCGNPNNTSYPRYGGRGIKVCQEWADDFEAFYIWAMAHGYQDGLQIDRIDNNGDYTPGNCRWITQGDNLNNTSRNIYIEWNGERRTIAEWAKKTGLSHETIRERYHAGKPPEEILKTE